MQFSLGQQNLWEVEHKNTANHTELVLPDSLEETINTHCDSLDIENEEINVVIKLADHLSKVAVPLASKIVFDKTPRQITHSTIAEELITGRGTTSTISRAREDCDITITSLESRKRLNHYLEHADELTFKSKY